MSTRPYYPTGADTDVYYTRSPNLSRNSVSSVIADFGGREPLDITGVVFVEEGQSIPLYDFAKRVSEHKIHTRRMVSGSLEFNVSEDYMRRRRSPGLQNMDGGSLWMVQKRLEYRPTPSVERDVIRISSVHERPFRHDHQPYAKESVPFIGRNATLVRRQIRRIDTGRLQDFVEQRDGFTVDGDDLIAEEIDEIVAEVAEVVDGDTYKVVPIQHGEEVTVRLFGADTPETKKEAGFGSKNRDGMADWRWPPGAPSRHGGIGGEAPSKKQLDAWGTYVTKEVRARIKGETVVLRRNPGAARKDKFGRHLFRLQHGGTDIGKRLIKSGYARPSDGLNAGIVNGGYVNRRQKLVDLYRAAKQNADSDGSKAMGIWFSFDPDTWENERSFTF